jgi:hypothetical protein
VTYLVRELENESAMWVEMNLESESAMEVVVEL